MKEDRLKDIRDKMFDYEADVPQDLWDAIDTAVGRRHRQKLWLRAGRYAAAAVAVVVVFIGSHFLLQDNTSAVSGGTYGHTAIARNGTFANAKSETSNINSDTEDDDTNAEVCASDLGHAPYATLARAEAKSDADTSMPSAEGDDKDNSESAPTSPVNPKESDAEIIAHTLPDIQSEYVPRKAMSGTDDERLQAQKSGRFGASIYTTAGTGGTSMQRYTSFGLMGIAPNNAEWKDNPYTGMLVSNQGRVSDRRVRHRLPVHAGASVAYRINNRISVEAGIAYSYLSADIHEGSDSYYFAGDQSLHYIGIPVGVRLRAVSWKNFDVYVGAGFEAEKCVSGTLKKAYVINGQTRDNGHESIRVRPLQWSVNATAGAQYNISPLVGIYVEPGLSYYFDNGSDIETAYSENPLNLNLNIGLRISFGNR